MRALIKTFVRFWGLLLLSGVSLLAVLVMVFVGTLGQVDQRLYHLKKKHFRI